MEMAILIYVLTTHIKAVPDNRNNKLVPIIGTGMSKQRIIILDIDHTIIHSIDIKGKMFISTHPIGNSFVIQNDRFRYMVFKRPYLSQFISFCFSHFDGVIFWSAGTRDYVHCILDNILEHNQVPMLVLTREDTVKIDGGIKKDMATLDRLLAHLRVSYPESTVVFVDDIVKRIINMKDEHDHHIIEANPYSTLWKAKLESSYWFRIIVSESEMVDRDSYLEELTWDLMRF